MSVSRGDLPVTPQPTGPTLESRRSEARVAAVVRESDQLLQHLLPVAVRVLRLLARLEDALA